MPTPRNCGTKAAYEDTSLSIPCHCSCGVHCPYAVIRSSSGSSAGASPYLGPGKKVKFEATNPALKADADNVDEMRAEEITANLRPNPQLTVAADGTQIAPHNGVWQPLAGTDVQPGVSYLHERDHKRELRTQSAKEGTQITASEHEDLKRNLEFTLRTAFVQTLEANAVVKMAIADLDYYDHIIEISRDRFNAGDIAQIDMDRIELMRVQYESELQTARVNLRTAKIQLLQLLNDRTQVDQFDVSGPFGFSDTLQPLDNFHQVALNTRPDLQAALETIQQSGTNHKLAEANGSTDPTFGAWYTYNSSTNNPNANQTLGASVSIPLRIFDKNQGEKKRTQIDIERSQRASEATRASLQRCGHRLRPGRERHCAAEALQSEVQRPGAEGARHGDLCLPARRRVADGFSECAKRLPAGAAGLRATHRRLSNQRGTAEFSHRARGDAMNWNSQLRTHYKLPYALALTAMLVLALSGCKSKEQGDGAPPPAKVVEVPDMNLITIDKNDVPKFPIVTANKVQEASELKVTGAVFPDISREVPVISVANGRVVDIKTRLDDNVKKGQLLFTVQSGDVTSAFNGYLKAVNDEQLANKAWLRAQDLFKHGALSEAMEQQAENSENDAKADLTAAEEQLKLLGVDSKHPTNLVNVYAPISGVIIAQNVTNAAAAGVTLSGSATAFTIADLSTVWVICDVHENDLASVQLGQEAQIKLSAFPERPLTGRVSDIGPVLDPSLRTAKVRIEMANPGFLKLGMFATATFTSRQKEPFAAIPANAILHLHDRDWVYVPAGGNRYRRTEVRAGKMLDGGMQQVLSGLEPGQQVVTNALLLDTAGNQ